MIHALRGRMHVRRGRCSPSEAGHSVEVIDVCHADIHPCIGHKDHESRGTEKNITRF